MVLGLLLMHFIHCVLGHLRKEFNKSLPPAVFPIWNSVSLIAWIKLFNKDTMKALKIGQKLRGNTFRINMIVKDLYITYEPQLVAKYVSKDWERMLDFYEPTSTVE